MTGARRRLARQEFHLGAAEATRNGEVNTKQSTQIKDMLVQFYDGFSRGDASVLMSLISSEPGVLNIGTDPQEWWDERDKLERALQAQMKELNGASLVPGHPQGWEEGSVGWASDRPVIRMADGTEIATRVTAVLRREGDHWKFVQTHISFGVGNEETVGQALTI